MSSPNEKARMDGGPSQNFDADSLLRRVLLVNCEELAATLKPNLPDTAVLFVDPGQLGNPLYRNKIAAKCGDGITVFTPVDLLRLYQGDALGGLQGLLGARLTSIPMNVSEIGADPAGLLTILMARENIQAAKDAKFNQSLQEMQQVELVSERCTPLSTQKCTETNLIIKPWRAVIAEAAEGREWLVDGLLPKTGLALLGGWAKEGKSTLAINLCRTVAEGKPFLGRTTLAAPAVYVNYEMPEDYRAELMTAGSTPESAFWTDRPAPVLTMDVVKKIISFVYGTPPIGRTPSETKNGLLVIDSFRGAFRLEGEGENLASAGVILRQLQDVAIETGWLFLVIHHLNKGKKDFSGTGDFEAAPDVLLRWTRSEPQSPGTLKVAGRMAPIEPMSVSLSLSEARYLGDAGQVARKHEEQRIINALTSEPVTAASVGESLEIPEGSARSYLAKLYEKGKIGREGSGKRGSPYLYCRPPEEATA